MLVLRLANACTAADFFVKDRVIFMRCIVLATALIICTAGRGYSQENETANSLVCEHKGTNGMVTMLLCPEGLDFEALVDEGRGVCEDRKPCGAWIWSNAEFIPDVTPDAHNKLPKLSVQNAVGVWINEQEQFLSIQKQ